MKRIKLFSYRFSLLKLNLVAVVATVLFNEILIYHLQKLRWERFVCESDECTRILLVSDPQILGEDHEFWISRWDNDRHLKQTFHQAVVHVKPKVILFLGDLMDEGSIADDEKFQNYYKRFQNIFQTPHDVKTIYIPGDNDIGGEGSEPVKTDKVIRFKNAFGQEEIWNLEQKIQIITPSLLIRDKMIKDSIDFNSTRITISHFPILYNIGNSYKTLQKFQPTIIFSAHDHRSREIVGDALKFSHKWPTPILTPKIFDLDLLNRQKKIIELQVTTCSYRMGTMKIGYAQAIFDNNLLIYSPMFIISRFYQLGFYVLFLLIMLIVNICIKKKRVEAATHAYSRLNINQ
ncbi:CLUMA_CG020847, isoform A [Clunio marinus]|uniref:CLUMA_CG020847, isoform A n=1 Tax=Clunio marinus TaxID=568069 RepID=A0A1J1J8A2_9DIPT|nr:CLUMA_CG020847, isoform A [Clunio marinus]